MTTTTTAHQHSKNDDDDADNTATPNKEEETITIQVFVDHAADEEHVTTVFNELLKGYLWERGETPTLMKKTNGEDGWREASITVVEEQNDGWFLVYAVKELTRRCEGVIATVSHSVEGEMLLVAAADALPAWLEPDTAKHRVFLKQGRLHIVPMNVLSQVQCTRDRAMHSLHDTRTLASDAIEKLAFAHIRDFPQKAMVESTHMVRVIVPRCVANAVALVPELVPMAVHALVMRSTTTLPVPSSGTNNEKITIMVRFTRLSYARLVSCCEAAIDATSLGNSLSEAFWVLANESQSTLLLDALNGKKTDVSLDRITTLIPNDDDAWMFTPDLNTMEKEMELTSRLMQPTTGLFQDVVGEETRKTKKVDEKVELDVGKFFNILNGKDLDAFFYEEDLDA